MAKPCRLRREGADYAQLGLKKGDPRPWEDTRRTHGGKGTFEWWYTDAEFDDGTTVVLIFFSKHYFDVDGPAWPTVDIEITHPDGRRTNVFTHGPKGVPVEAGRDCCDLTIEKNFIRYENGCYRLHYEDHDVVYDALMKPEMPMWRPDTGVFEFGSGTDSRAFAWFVAVPDANVEATLALDGVTRTLKGRGYHDHNWGDVPMNSILNHWYWGRAKIGRYNIVACDLIATKEYGYKRLPLFMVAKDGIVLSDDCTITQVERSKTHQHSVTGKFMDDRLVYTQHVSDEEEYSVEFNRAGDILNRSLLEVATPMQRFFGKLLRMNPTYTRCHGTVGVVAMRDGRVERVSDTGLWEQYFMGSNKKAHIDEA